MKKLLLVGYSAENRTKASGYEHIIDFESDEYQKTYLDAATLPFGFIPTGKRGKRLNLYFLEIVSHSIAHKFDVMHNFYCDNQLLFKYPKNRKYSVVATTHLNYHNFTDYQIKVLKSYDAVIVLNSVEERILRDKGIKAYYIPHGFDKPLFKLNEDILSRFNDKINICFSGVCYRDYKTLDQFIELIRNNKNIILHVLGQKKEIKNRLRSLGQKNVVVYDFLSDDDYYSIMSQCDYNFLPLTFATANNTLLEAQFLGVRSIIPNIEGTKDYASTDYNLLYNDLSDIADFIPKLRKQRNSEELMHYAQKFCWHNIFAKTEELYDMVCKNR